MVEQYWWNSSGGTVMVERKWWNSYGGKLVVKSTGGTVVVEQ